MPMAPMTWYGKNDNIWPVSSPLAELWTLQESILGLCLDFLGGVNVSRVGQVNFWFLAKIKLFAWYHEVWVQKVQNLLLSTHFNTQS